MKRRTLLKSIAAALFARDAKCTDYTKDAHDVLLADNKVENLRAGFYNPEIGRDALRNCYADRNINMAIGYKAGFNTGQTNIAIGSDVWYTSTVAP